MAKKVFIVAHPKLMLMVKGKLAQVAKGSEISMDEKHAASLLKQGKVLVKGESKTVDVGGSVKKLTAAQKKKLEGEIQTLQDSLAEANSKVESLEGEEKAKAETEVEELTKSLAEANDKLNA